MCAIEDKTAVVVVVLYRSVLRNPVRFKALVSVRYRSLESCNIEYLLRSIT